MTDAAAVSARGGLPPLSGRLLWPYRISWMLLALAAVAALTFSLVSPDAQPIVIVLRLVKAAIIIAVAAILFRRRPRDPVAALLSFAFLCWTITSSFDFTAADKLPMLLDRLRFLLFALALLLFPDGEWRPRWTRHAAAASILVFFVGLAEGVGLLPTQLFLPLAIGCVLAAIGALIQRFRSARSEAQRQQLKWVALGLVLGVTCILSARAGAALHPGWGDGAAVLLEALFQLGIVLIALGLLVSLLRYRLFDAESAVSRSAAYVTLTISLVAIFAGSEAVIEMLGQRYFGMGLGDVSAAIAAAFAAVLLTPLHSRISNWAEQRFQRDLVMLKEQVPELLADLAGSCSGRELAAAVLPRIGDAIHATRAALLSDGSVAGTHQCDLNLARQWARQWPGTASGTRFSSDPTDLLFPLRMALPCPLGGAGGWLLLGPRPDGSLYGKNERAALEAIAPALRRALLAAVHREMERARHRRVYGTILGRVNQLSRRVEMIGLLTADRQ